MSSTLWMLALLCLWGNLSGISAHADHTSLRFLRPRQGMGGMGGGKGGGGKGMAGAAGGAAAGGGATGETAGGGCGSYTIVSARGTGEKQKNPTGYAGFIKGLLGTAKGGSNYEVVYPATVDYMNGPKQGATDALKYITKQKGKCPNIKFVLIGYSEGAMVVVQLLAKQGIPASDISSIIMYGNPYWQAGQKWNVGTATTGKGVASATGIKLPPSFGGRTQDICLKDDMVCTGKGGMTAHLKYPGTKYEKDAVQYSAKLLSGEPASPGGGASEGGHASSEGGAKPGKGKGGGGKPAGGKPGGGGGGGGLAAMMGGAGGT